MKNTIHKLLILALFISLFSSCDMFKNDDDGAVDNFLVSYDLGKSYLPNFIQTVFTQFEGDYPALSAIKEKAVNGVMVYKITYNTTFDNQLKKASGLVCIPTGEGPFPIMSYQNGTNTLHSNAPSVNPDYELYLLLEFVASTGFVVVIPDYLGFGASANMFHPYLDKTSTIKTVLDILRATKELTMNHLQTEINNDLYIAGYSQGGWATMQLAKEIEEKYQDQYNLKASACGAGPYDLNYINEYVTGLENYPMPYFLAYMFNSYINLGVNIPAGDVFQAPYATKINTLFNGTKSGDQINAELTTTVSDLFTADYLNNYGPDGEFAAVDSILEANSIAAWETEIPTMIIHGMEDEFVPKEVSTNLYQDFLQKDVSLNTVKWEGLPGLGHTTGIIPSGLLSVSWFLQIKDSN